MTEENSASAASVQKPSAGIGRYLLFAYAISWTLFVVASILTLNGITAAFAPLSAIGMFGPLLSVILISRGIGRAKTGVAWKPAFRGKWGWWALAWAGPIVLAIFDMGVYYLVFPARYDPTCTSYITAMYGAAAAQSMGTLTPAACLINGSLSALAGALINMLFAVGEEAGWRGYLYPRLKARFGRGKGRIFGGLIWGSWHWPLIILVGYEYNWGIFNAPWYLVLAGMLAFCLVCVALGTLLDWLYEKTGCIWVPALAHGAFNASAGMGLSLLVADYAGQLILGPSAIGLVSGIPMFAAALAVSLLGRRRA